MMQVQMAAHELPTAIRADVAFGDNNDGPAAVVMVALPLSSAFRRGRILRLTVLTPLFYKGGIFVTLALVCALALSNDWIAVALALAFAGCQSFALGNDRIGGATSALVFTSLFGVFIRHTAKVIEKA